MSELEHRLRAENETLREEVRQLRAQLGLVAHQAEVARCCDRLEVSPSGANLLLALLNAPFLTHEQCLAAVPPRGARWEDERTLQLVTVLVHKLRRALPPGCGIRTTWGEGYSIPESSKARIRALLADAAAVEPKLEPA